MSTKIQKEKKIYTNDRDSKRFLQQEETLTDEKFLLKKDILTDKRNFHKNQRFFQICLLYYFFVRKDFERKKTFMSKNQLTKQNKHTKATEAIFFMRAKTSKGVKIVCLTLGGFCTFKIKSTLDVLW